MNLPKLVRLVGSWEFNRDRVDAGAQTMETIVTVFVRLGCEFGALVAYSIDHHIDPRLPRDVENVAAQRSVQLRGGARRGRPKQCGDKYRDTHPGFAPV